MLGHKTKSSSQIRMYPRKTEARCDISKCKKYYFPWAADPPIVNSTKKVCFGVAKVDISFKFGGSKFVQNNFMRASFCGCIKNNSRILPRLDLHSLSGMTTP